MGREQLAPAQRSINAFPSEGVEEIGCVSDQRCARGPGATRCHGKWTRRSNRGDSLGADKSFSEMRSRRDPALEEGCLILADLFGAGHWYDHGDVHQAIAYLHDAEVSIVIDVHLAHIGHALDLPE